MALKSIKVQEVTQQSDTKMLQKLMSRRDGEVHLVVVDSES